MKEIDFKMLTKGYPHKLTCIKNNKVVIYCKQIKEIPTILEEYKNQKFIYSKLIL